VTFCHTILSKYFVLLGCDPFRPDVHNKLLIFPILKHFVPPDIRPPVYLDLAKQKITHEFCLSFPKCISCGSWRGVGGAVVRWTIHYTPARQSTHNHHQRMDAPSWAAEVPPKNDLRNLGSQYYVLKRFMVAGVAGGR
jgi:hypothetical protein